MNAVARDVSKSGLRPLLWIAFLSLPSLLAFSASAGLSQQGAYASALWFLYVVSRLFAYIGMLIAASLTIGIGIRRSASALFLILMALSVSGSALLLWYASHIFPSP